MKKSSFLFFVLLFVTLSSVSAGLSSSYKESQTILQAKTSSGINPYAWRLLVEKWEKFLPLPFLAIPSSNHYVFREFFQGSFAYRIFGEAEAKAVNISPLSYRNKVPP
ncbi:MAG: hypothetical protein WC467_03920 [Patescibacteria group bacterium]